MLENAGDTSSAEPCYPKLPKPWTSLKRGLSVSDNDKGMFALAVCEYETRNYPSFKHMTHLNETTGLFRCRQLWFYDPLCVCVRVYVGIRCKRDQMLKKDEKRLWIIINVSQNPMTCRLSSPTCNIPTMLNLGVCVSTKTMTLGVVLWGRKCQPALPGFKHPSSPSNCL